MQEGREKTWRALWDTGSPITIIPYAFVEELQYTEANRTKYPLHGFDTSQQGRCHDCYLVKIGLPELPLFRLRAIAPDDSARKDEDRRHHISLGCDVISRLRVSLSSNIKWDYHAAPNGSSVWKWRYRRAFPHGVFDGGKAPIPKGQHSSVRHA